jgi:hypothetical protein
MNKRDGVSKMKRKGSFYKILFYTQIASIFIFGRSCSYGYIWSKTFEEIDIEIEGSMQRVTNCGYIMAASTSPLLVPKQPAKHIGIFIQPRVLNIKAKGNIFFSWISLPEEYDPHAISSDSLELSVLSCPKCKIIYPSYQFPVHGKYLTVFLRKDLIDIIETMDLDLPAKLYLKVYGEMNDGTSFEGLETIWIIKQIK